MPAEDLETVCHGADAWARRAKAAGDPRTLDQLRVGALVEWATCFLTTGTSTPHTDNLGPMPGPPRRHGRPITVNVTIDLPTFLGLTDSPGEVLGTGALIPADAIRDLIPDAAIRRVIYDPQTGHLLDLGMTTRIPTPALADFCAMRDVTPTTPTAGLTPAGAGDLDHNTRPEDGGPTNRDNLHSPNRRWHRAKTLTGWTVTPNPDRTWTWTSPAGRTYRTQPHDYRLGP
jgi:hypothetical protein